MRSNKLKVVVGQSKIIDIIVGFEKEQFREKYKILLFSKQTLERLPEKKKSTMLKEYFFYSIVFTFLLQLFICGELQAQDGKTIITCVVRDNKTNERIGSAIISDGRELFGLTDSSGFLRFHAKAGTYKLECRQIGYAASFKEITAGLNDKEVVLFFNMNPRPVEMEKVTITGKRYKDTEKFKTYELKSGDISNIPVFLESDALRAVQSLPGVTAPHDFSSLIYLRGGNFDETLVALDDVPVYNLFHVGGIFGAINPDIIESIILYPSNYPVNYQGVLSGVLSIRSKAGNQDGLRGTASIGLLSSKMYLNGPLPLGNFVFSARRTYPDLYMQLILDKPFPYYFYDFNGKYTLPINNNNLFSAWAFFSKDIFDPFNDAKPPILEKKEDLNWGNKVLRLSYDNIHEKNNFNTSIYYSESFFRADTKRFPDYSDLYYRIPGDSANRVEHIYINNYIRDMALKAEYEFQLTGQKFNIGAEYKKLSVSYSWDIKENHVGDLVDNNLAGIFFDFAPDVYSLSDNTGIYSMFVSDEILITDRFIANVGYRGLYIGKIKRYLNSPYLMLNYNISNDIGLSASYGRYYEFFFTRRDLINGRLSNPFAIYYISNNHSAIPGSEHYSLGIKIEKLPLNFRSEIEAYYKTRENLSSSDALTRKISVDNGYSYGVDVLFKNEIDEINGWIAYSFSRSIKNNGKYKYYSEYDRTHNIKVSLSYNLSDRWEVNALWIYATGMTYTPVIGKYFSTDYGNADLSGEMSGEGMVLDAAYGRKNTNRYPDHHRLDIGLIGSFIWGSFLAKPYLQIMNVYSSSNPFSYNPDPLDSNYEKSLQTGSYVIPTIGLTVEF